MVERKILVEALRRLSPTDYEAVDKIHSLEESVSEFSELKKLKNLESVLRDIELFFVNPTLRTVDNKQLELREVRITGTTATTEIVAKIFKLRDGKFAVIHRVSTIRKPWILP